MRATFVPTRLAEVLRPVWRQVRVDPFQKYTLLGVRWYAGGLFKKDVKSGGEIKASSLYEVRPRDFVYNRLFAWKGSFAVADESVAGCFVSNEFPCFEVDESRADPGYLLAYFRKQSSWNQALGLSTGATPTSRNRLKESSFLAMEVPLPSIEDQRRIVARLDAIASKIEEASRLRTEIDTELSQLLATVRSKIAESGIRMRLGDVAPLERRPVAIDVNQVYPQVAVRSFGRGPFHREPLIGADVSWERPFRVQRGDIVISNIKAWEGAIAVARPEDDGRVASHRYLTLVPRSDVAIAQYLVAYLLSPEGLLHIGEASPGSADRNRTLSAKKLMEIEVPVPPLAKQRTFETLVASAERVRSERSAIAVSDAELMPALLGKAFQGML